MSIETALPLLMFVSVFLLILVGYPVAFTLGGVGILFGLIGYSLDLFYLSDFNFVPVKVFGIVENFTLIAVPLFIFMGVIFEKSGIAREILERASKVLAYYPAGMPLSVIGIGALLAASTGIVGASVVTLGILALPSLIERGFSPKFSAGLIATSGTLGQIIPPSILLILLGDIMNVDVGSLFVGAIAPGCLLVSLYALYVIVFGKRHFSTETTEALPTKKLASGEIKSFFLSLIPPLSLTLVVLGSILLGAASPTEAAACGASGALFIAFMKGKLSFNIVSESSEQTVILTSMVFTLLIGAQIFSVVFRGLYGDEVITELLTGFNLSPPMLLLLTMLLLFVLGFFLDFIEICFIVLPVITPILFDLGYDPLWLAILIAVNLQTSFLTPPFGFALFYLKGVAPKEVSTATIYKGVVPFIALQLIALVLLYIFPTLVTFLPKYFLLS
jgi:tripartite ATP-independent transporter DctM subunit